MAILLVLVVAAIPLLITPNLHLLFDVTPKAALLLAGAAAALALAAFRRCGLGNLLRDREGRWLAALLAAGCVSAVLSTTLSVDRALSFSGSDWRRFGLPVRLALAVFTFLAAAWLAGGKDRSRLLVRTLAVCGLLAGSYGILQYFGWDPWLPQAAYRAGEAPWTIVRPPSTLGHAGYFASWLLIPLFAGCALALDEKGRLWRVLGIASAAVGAVAILLSGTRAAMLGLVAGAIVLVLWLRPRPSRATVAAVFLALVAVAGFYVSPPGDALRRRMHWIGEDPTGGARLQLWSDSLAMASHRLPAGYGPETFPVAFPRFQSTALANAYPDFYHESPHNLFLETLTEQGLPGLVIFGGLIALGFIAAIRTAKLGPVPKALGAALAAVLVSQQFTPLSLPAALYIQLTIAILVAACVGAGEPVAYRIWPWPVALLLAVAAVRVWGADSILLSSAAALDRGDVHRAVARFRQAEGWGARADLWYSRRMALAAQRIADPTQRVLAWQEALSAAARATETAEDRHNAWYNLAMFRAVQNDLAGTEQALRQSIQCAPNWFKGHWMLARLLARSGRPVEARSEAEKAVMLDAGKHPEVNSQLPQ